MGGKLCLQLTGALGLCPRPIEGLIRLLEAVVRVFDLVHDRREPALVDTCLAKVLFSTHARAPRPIEGRVEVPRGCPGGEECQPHNRECACCDVHRCRPLATKGIEEERYAGQSSEEKARPRAKQCTGNQNDGHEKERCDRQWTRRKAEANCSNEETENE